MIRLGIAMAAFLIGTATADAQDAATSAADIGTAAMAQVTDGSALKGTPLPFNLGGAFSLVDQNGMPRTEVDPAGNLQLLFFGYANCREICSAVLPQMAGVAQDLAARGMVVTPVFITVDPKRDTVASLGPALQVYGPDFVGLTGDDAALQVAYRAFAIDSSMVFEDPFRGPVYAHGSFLYLLDADGKFLTVIPPILSDEKVVDLIASFAPAG